MLRLITLLLLLINLVYWLWSDGSLPGWAPELQAEPQRLKEQIKPQAIRLLTASQAHQLEATTLTTAKAPACLQAGPFSQTHSAQLHALLTSALEKDSWALQPVVTPARWIVYMGKYANAEELIRKRSELNTLKIQFESLSDPALQYGLSLGSYETGAAATAALEVLSRRGIRTARVVQQAEHTRTVLRIDAADVALRTRLSELDPALGDKAWSACPG